MATITLGGAEFFDADGERLAAQLIGEAFDDAWPFGGPQAEHTRPVQALRFAPYLGTEALLLGEHSISPAPYTSNPN